jgi:preprotein translocase subunit SecA
VGQNETVNVHSVGQKMYDDALSYLNNKKTQYSEKIMAQATKFFMLQTLDDLWKDHLLTMDHLRDGIGLRGYGNKDPKMEYKKEGFALFQDMMARFHQQSVERIFKVQIQKEEEVQIKEDPKQQIQESHGPVAKQAKSTTVKKIIPDTKPNEPCPCGSGKKYKRCHGVEAA